LGLPSRIKEIRLPLSNFPGLDSWILAYFVIFTQCHAGASEKGSEELKGETSGVGIGR